jgi:hypothetical protein
VIAAYYVLEHVRDIQKFVQTAYDQLKKEGYFIIEVPNLDELYYHLGAISCVEHLNFFTPKTLESFMHRYGFVLRYVSKQFCSRDFGFVAVFQKIDAHELPILADYLYSKDMLLGGLAKEEKKQLKWMALTDQIKVLSKEQIVFWCANAVIAQIAEIYEKKYGGFDFTIIDSDSRRNKLLNQYSVFIPTNVKSLIKKAKYFFIGSHHYFVDICNKIKEIRDNEHAEFIDVDY